MNVDSTSPFFEALLLPYLVALKAINPFKKAIRMHSLKPEILDKGSKLLNLAILTSFSQNSQLLKGLGRKFEKAYTSFLHLIMTYHLDAK